MIYVVSYDRPFGLLRANEAFLSQIRSLGQRYVMAMERMWLVDTNLTPQQISQRLVPFLTGTGDRLLITLLASGYYGWLPQEAWDWIRQTPGWPQPTLGPPGFG